MKQSFETRLLYFVLDELDPNQYYLEQKFVEKHLWKLYNIPPAYFPFKFEDKLISYFYIDFNLGRMRLNFDDNKWNERVVELFKNDIIDGSIDSNWCRDVNLLPEPRFHWFDKVPVEGLEIIDNIALNYARLKLF